MKTRMIKVLLTLVLMLTFNATAQETCYQLEEEVKLIWVQADFLGIGVKTPMLVKVLVQKEIPC